MTPYHSEQTRIKTLAMLSTAAVLLMAAFTIPAGLIAAEARSDDDRDDDDKKERDNDRNDDDKREFSRLFGKNKDKEKDKDRKPNVDPRDAVNFAGNFDRSLRDLDIKNYGFDGKDAFIQVYGKAGETVSEDHDGAIAYVLNIITRSGEEQTWAIDSHEKQHGDTGTGSMWHAHRVHLTDDLATPEVDASCLNEVDEVTHAMMDGHRAIFENVKAKGVGAVNAKKITSAATVELQVLVDDPDNPPPGTLCIAKVAHVYDTADLTKRERRD